MHRFFVPPETLKAETITLTDDAAHQIRNVLRMKAGDHITLLDNTGWAYEVELLAINKREISAQLLSKNAVHTEPNVSITLFQGLPKHDRFEWILQKGTELGVQQFIPTLTARTVRDKISANKQARWERIMTEAAEQSGRGRLPTLSAALSFDEVLASLNDFDLAIIPYEGETAQSFRDVLRTHPNAAHIGILIGPEGGFEADEVEAAIEHGAKSVSLGARILRTETAAITAAGLVMYEYGELDAPPLT